MKARIPQNIEESEIQQWYKEYQEIVKLPMPMINIKFYDGKGDNWNGHAYHQYDETNGNTITVEHLLFQHNKRYFKDVLFHEFTHILDYIHKDKVESFSYTAFTEIHASFIKLASAFNIDWTSEIQRRLSLKYTLVVFNEQRTIQRFIEVYFEELFDYFEKLKTEKNNKIINSIFQHILCCFGYLQFCDIYCCDESLKLIYFPQITDKFGLDILCLYEIVKFPYNFSKIDFNIVQRATENFYSKMLDVSL